MSGPDVAGMGYHVCSADGLDGAEPYCVADFMKD